MKINKKIVPLLTSIPLLASKSLAILLSSFSIAIYNGDFSEIK